MIKIIAVQLTAVHNTISLLRVFSFPEYLEKFKPVKNTDATIEETWLKKVEIIDELLVQNNVAVFLWNAYTGRFIYMSNKIKTIAGLDPAMYTKPNGVEESFSNFHPEHLHAAFVLMEKGVNSFVGLNDEQVKSTVSSLNYLYKNAKAGYGQILQTMMILEYAENGKPLLFLGMVHDIGHVKKYNSAGIAITTAKGAELFEYDFDKKSIGPGKKIFEQEKRVIELMAQGMDSKTMAEKLFVSLHTINTHRRNIIKKTSCIDSTAVVTFARLINLIQ